MNSRKTDVSRLSLLAGGAFAVAAMTMTPAAAQQPEMPKGWFKACSKQEDVDICNVQNISVADTGQLLTGVSLIEVKGKVNRKIFRSEERRVGKECRCRGRWERASRQSRD